MIMIGPITLVLLLLLLFKPLRRLVGGLLWTALWLGIYFYNVPAHSNPNAVAAIIVASQVLYWWSKASQDRQKERRAARILAEEIAKTKEDKPKTNFWGLE